jgi:predicted RNA-binding Zn ribbon-like protein
MRSGSNPHDTCNTGVVANLLDDLPREELRFHFLAGRPCLDLAATVGERWGRCFERLRAPEDLGRWLVEAGLLESAPPVEERQLEQARALRDAIYEVAKLAGVGAPNPADVSQINWWAARPTLAPQLGANCRQLSWVADDPVEASLATVARDAVELLSGPLAQRVRECAAEDCALLFVDTSRPGRRRWCSMDGCGNRAKTAAYRRRHALKESR